ncbi:unnamed protein product [Mytilus coruscus]|uniref:C1q domain-containing protein n=1 Tax=Mytilus coruscus TaxID=42192 RepID=A0A6J8BJZ6_MYTCO|nr:unnamed protein product [Mytilus coruscus]
MNSFITLNLLLFLSKKSLSVTVEDNKLQRIENAVKELQQQRLEDLKRIESLENELSTHNRKYRPRHMVKICQELEIITIHFDRVITNNGQPYNPLDGIFHTPVTGTYVFVWTTTNRDHSFMNSELLKNGVRVARAMSDAMDHIDYAVATSFAVINLTVGDEVWIQSGTWHSSALAGDDYSSFAGWILN